MMTMFVSFLGVLFITLLVLLAVWAVGRFVVAGGPGVFGRLLSLAVPATVGVVVFVGLAALLGIDDVLALLKPSGLRKTE